MRQSQKDTNRLYDKEVETQQFVAKAAEVVAAYPEKDRRSLDPKK